MIRATLDARVTSENYFRVAMRLRSATPRTRLQRVVCNGSPALASLQRALKDQTYGVSEAVRARHPSRRTLS